MDHVKLARPFDHAFEERRERHHWIDDGRAQPQRLRTNSDNSARVFEPPLANSVTASPRSMSSSVSQETTRSVPP